MKTLNYIKKQIEMQYALESYIELYNTSEYCSDKYLIKLKLIDFIETQNYSISEVLDYMKLDEQKFEPFILMLFNTKQSKRTRNTLNNSRDNYCDSHINYINKLKNDSGVFTRIFYLGEIDEDD